MYSPFNVNIEVSQLRGTCHLKEVQQIKHIQKILELSNEQRDHIFFAEAVDK